MINRNQLQPGLRISYKNPITLKSKRGTIIALGNQSMLVEFDEGGSTMASTQVATLRNYISIDPLDILIDVCETI